MIAKKGYCFFSIFVLFFLADRLHRGHPLVTDEKKMEQDQEKKRPRKKNHMANEKSGKGLAANRRAAPQHRLCKLTNKRHGSRHLSPHRRGPVSQLVPRQQIPRKSKNARHYK